MAAPKIRLVPKKSRYHTANPTYMTGTLQEYQIKFEEGRGWYIHKYAGGIKPRSLEGHWGQHKNAEQTLILYIKKHNKRGLARYPGCPEPRQTNYTRTFLKG